MFQEVKPLTLLSSLKSMKFHLWDEQGRKLISFARLREIRKEGAAARAVKELRRRVDEALASGAGENLDDVTDQADALS